MPYGGAVQRDGLPLLPQATYVLPQYRVAYVSTAKAACSSMKWMLAELAGEDLDAFARSLAPEVTPATTIHQRTLWQRTPTLEQLDDDELAAVEPATWFLFAVTRDPASRLWSAWQSKLLLAEPRYRRVLAGQSWLPRVPRSTEEVVADFRRFVLGLRPGGESEAVLRDRHFRPQVEVLRPGHVPYRRVYRTPEIPRLLEDLAVHVAAHGGPGLPSLRVSNDTPLAPHRDAFGDDVLEVIGTVYGADVDAFGLDGGPPRGLTEVDYPDAVLREVARLVERSTRIGDLSDQARELRAENERLHRRLRRQRSQRGAAPRTD